MPMIQKKVSIAANSSNDNLLSGYQMQILPYDAVVQFALCGSAAGLVADIYSGNDLVAEGYELNTQNRYPVVPDDVIGSDVAAALEPLKIRVRNTTAGALDCFFRVDIMPA